MALDFGKQIAFKGGATRKGTFKKQDLGHNAYIQRMREQLNLTNYKEVAAKTTRAAKDTLSVIESNQVKQLNNKKEIAQFEQRALDTAAKATEQVAKQWADYGDEEVAQIGRDADSLSGLVSGFGELAKSAGGVLVARERNREVREGQIEATGRIQDAGADAFGEQAELKTDLTNKVIDDYNKNLKKPGYPDNITADHDGVAFAQKNLKAHPGHELRKFGHKVGHSIYKVDDTLRTIKGQLREELTERGLTTQFNDKQFNDIARALVLKIHGIEGVYSKEANAVREHLLTKLQNDEKVEFDRNNLTQNRAIWEQNVTEELRKPNVTLADVESVLENITNQDTLLYFEGGRLKGQEALKHVIDELIASNNVELAHDLINNSTPTRDGVPIKGKKSWDEFYKGSLSTHIETQMGAGNQLVEQNNALAQKIEGQKIYKSIDENWDLTPDHPDYEGSGAQLYELYQNGTREPFVKWVNDQLNLLKEYPEYHDKLSAMFWAETWANKAWAKGDQLIKYAEKTEDWGLFLKELSKLTKSEQQKHIKTVQEFQAINTVYNLVDAFPTEKQQIIKAMGLESAYAAGHDIKGIDQVTETYLAQKLSLMRAAIRPVDEGGQGMHISQVRSWAEERMDVIYKAGMENPDSPYSIISSKDSGEKHAKLRNVFQTEADGYIQPQEISKDILEMVTPSTDLTGVTTHDSDNIRAYISDPGSEFNQTNGELTSKFWRVDLNRQANTIYQNGLVKLTDTQQIVYDSIKYRVPGYTETQFLSDVLLGQGYNVTADGMATKDIVNAGSTGENTTKLITNAKTNARLHKINLYTKAINNNQKSMTVNQAARDALAIDYTGSVSWDEHPYYSKKDQEAQGYLYRMSSDIDVNPQNLLDSLTPFSDEIHGLHLNDKSIVCKEGTEECEWANKNMNKSTSVDWRIPGGTTNDSWFYLPK